MEFHSKNMMSEVLQHHFLNENLEMDPSLAHWLCLDCHFLSFIRQSWCGLRGKAEFLKYVETLSKYLQPLHDKFQVDKVSFQHDNASIYPEIPQYLEHKVVLPGEESQSFEVARSILQYQAIF